MAPRGPKRAKRDCRRSKIAPRGLKDNSKMAARKMHQTRFRVHLFFYLKTTPPRLQDGLTRAPTWPQEDPRGPKMALRNSKMSPRGLKDDSKIAAGKMHQTRFRVHLFSSSNRPLRGLKMAPASRSSIGILPKVLLR